MHADVHEDGQGVRTMFWLRATASLVRPLPRKGFRNLPDRTFIPVPTCFSHYNQLHYPHCTGVPFFLFPGITPPTQSQGDWRIAEVILNCVIRA